MSSCFLGSISKVVVSSGYGASFSVLGAYLLLAPIARASNHILHLLHAAPSLLLSSFDACRVRYYN